MTQFTPISALLGGALIGLAASLLMLFNGRIAGISGYLSRLLPPWDDDELAGRLVFVLGLFLAPFLLRALPFELSTPEIRGGLPLMVVAGLLVGFGTVLGSGCTSGHGVCGLARLSPRSLLATLTFMALAVLTVLLVRHVLGA